MDGDPVTPLRLAALLDEALQALDDALFEGPRGALQAAADQFRAQRLHLAVLGQFKRSKSSLVNAILRRPILPTGILPVTAVPTFIQGGPRVHVRVRFLDGTSRDMPVESLPSVVSEKENPENGLGVSRVEIETPCPLLDDGVVLIDTPGIGSAHAHNTASTLAMLPQCDAALVVLSADPPVTEAELRFFDEMRSHVPRLFYVLNKADALSADDRREVLAYLRDVLRARAAFSGDGLWPVSARQALHAAGPQYLEASGLPALERELRRFLEEEKGATLVQTTCMRTSHALGEALQLVDIQEASLRMPLEAFEQREGRLGALIRRLEHERTALSDVLAAARTRILEPLHADSRALARDGHSAVTHRLRKEARDESVSLEELRDRLQRASEETIRAFFDSRAPAFVERARLLALDALAPAADRARQALDQAAAEIAALFSVAAVHAESPDIAVEWRRMTWKTWFAYGRGGADHVVGEALLRLRSRRHRLERMVASIDEEAERLCIRNANVLYNEVGERVQKALTAAARALGDELARLGGSARAAVEAAGQMRARGERAAAQRLDVLRRLRRDVTGAREQVERLREGAREA